MDWSALDVCSLTDVGLENLFCASLTASALHWSFLLLSRSCLVWHGPIYLFIFAFVSWTLCWLNNNFCAIQCACPLLSSFHFINLGPFWNGFQVWIPKAPSYEYSVLSTPFNGKTSFFCQSSCLKIRSFDWVLLFCCLSAKSIFILVSYCDMIVAL